MSYQVFISHSSKDKNIADAVCNHLENSGIACWIAPRDIKVGSEWAKAIVDGISTCKVLLLLFTENSDASPQVLREVERAISKGLIIVPLRLENLLPTNSMEFYLSAVHWLDAYLPPHERHFEVISDRIKSILDGTYIKKSRALSQDKIARPYSSGKYLSEGELSTHNTKYVLATSLFSKAPFVVIEQNENFLVMIGTKGQNVDWQYEGDNVPIINGAARIYYMQMTDNLFKFNSTLQFRASAIKRDFDEYARHADFEDVRKFSSIIGAPQFIDVLGLREVTNPEITAYDGVDYWNQGPFVTYNGATSEGSRAYFISVHDGVLLDDWRIIDTIDKNTIDLGSWHNNRPVLILYEKECSIELDNNNIKILE
jgi:hypothetical protein